MRRSRKPSPPADRAKLAEAKLAGKKQMPEPKDVEAARQTLDECERQRGAADTARRRAAEIVLETLEAHRAEWIPQAEEAEECAAADEAAALVTYLVLVEARAVAAETLAWMRGFPSQKRNYTPRPGQLRYVGRRDPIGWDDVAYALKVRAGLADAPPKTLGEHIRAAGHEPAKGVAV
jgi:hypothetical protein